MCMVNSYAIGKPGLFYQKCMYLDTSRHMARRLFKEKHIKVKVTEDDFEPGDDLEMVWCKVRKRDLDKFREAMEELGRNMMVLGDKAYEEYCDVVSKYMTDNDLVVK